MDFIERIFHISPDGGSGATEVLILMALVFLVAFAAIARWRLRRSSR